MKHRITLVPGDGIGPDVALSAKRCVEATGVSIQWDIKDAGSEQIEKYGTPLPDEVIESIKETKIALKGPIETPVGHGFRSVNVALRQILNLYACVRPCKTYPGVRSRYSNIDITIIRENTEDLYAGIELEKGKDATLKLIDFIEKHTDKKILKDSGISIKPISVHATQKIVQFAFDYAIKNKRKKVTAVHKANIMKFSDGLFLQTAKEVATKYTNIPFENRIVDNMCMQLVSKPELYDVLVLPNLYGDIISDLCAGLVGGLGVAPGANIGDGIAVFEATHGSAPKYKGLNKVNPTAMILSAVMMLRYIKENECAQKLENAVAVTIKENKFVTYDLKPEDKIKEAVGTKEMTDEIIRNIKHS